MDYSPGARPSRPRGGRDVRAPGTESLQSNKPATEQTIDDILRELTGQTLLPDDPLQILSQASGDYTRNHTVEEAIRPTAPDADASPTASEYGDLTDMDELETLLDLARAYIGMDELDAAHELLLDVEARGTENQQTEARRWLGECLSRKLA